MTTETIERKWALTRIGKGDYLLPSNDKQTLWRICSYDDGPTYGLDVEWTDRKFWSCWKYTLHFDGTFDPDDLDWAYWEQWDSSMDTRREAVERALKMGSEG